MGEEAQMSILSSLPEAVEVARKMVGLAIDILGTQGVRDLLTEADAKQVNEGVDQLQLAKFGE